MGAPMNADYRVGRARLCIGQYVSLSMGEVGFVLVRVTQNDWIHVGMATGRVIAFQGDNLADDRGGPRPDGAPFNVDDEIEFNVREIARVHDFRW